MIKDLIKTPQVWKMALAVRGDAVDVVLNSTVEDNQLIYRRLTLDASMPPLAAFEELIYQNPLLLSDFCKISILVDTDRYTIVPAVLDDDARQDVVHALWPDQYLELVSCDIYGTGEVLLMGVESGLLAFLKRTFIEGEISHPVAVLSNHFWPLSQQGNSGKVYGVLPTAQDSTESSDDEEPYQKLCVVGFAADKRSPLRIACQYQVKSAADMAYYMLAAAQTSGYSLDRDEFLLCGDPKVRDEVATELRQVATYVMPAVFPSALFKAGAGGLTAPYELLISLI